MKFINPIRAYNYAIFGIKFSLMLIVTFATLGLFGIIIGVDLIKTVGLWGLAVGVAMNFSSLFAYYVTKIYCEKYRKIDIDKCLSTLSRKGYHIK